MSEEKPISLRASERDEYYRIDIKRDDFKDFLRSVLGDRRSIQRTITELFVVKVADLMNIHHMILQRVDRQNQSAVSTFRCIIDFADNFRRTIDGFGPFEHIAEIKTERIVRLYMEYSFLIQFPDKPFPEKQEVIIRFEAEPSRAVRSTGSVNPVYFEDPVPSRISLEVLYTELTWGDDIDHMLTPYIRSNITRDNSGGRFSTAYLFLKRSVITAFAFYCFYFLWQLISFRDFAAIHQRDSMIGKIGRELTVDDKLNALLIDATSVIPSFHDYFALGIKSIPIIGFLVIFTLLSDYMNRESHIILNQRGEDRLKAESNSNNLIRLAVCLAFFISVTAGLAANYITKFIDSW